MAFSNEDRNWLDEKFSDVHRTMNDNKEELTAMIVNTKDHARELVEKHEEKKHNPAKTLGVLGSLAGLGAAAWEGLKALMHLGSKGAN